MGDAWTALSTIIAGIAVWGAIGFALDRAFGTAPVLMVAGVLIGNFAAIYLIYVRAVNAEKTRGGARSAAPSGTGKTTGGARSAATSERAP
jgi:F0F1-type ATP synthase assembly protein I